MTKNKYVYILNVLYRESPVNWECMREDLKLGSIYRDSNTQQEALLLKKEKKAI